MDPSGPGPRGWPPQLGGSAHQNADQKPPQANRPAFGAGQQSPPQGHSGLPPPPPPPAGPFPHFHQPPSLANLAGISQSSPRQPARPEVAHQPPPQLALPGFSQATGQPGTAERERERARDADTHIKEEEDRKYRELQERQRFEQAPPHQPPPGPPMHLHQPVAVGPRSAVHGPNGLLANPNQQQPQMPLGAPSGPANIFAGGPVQPVAQAQGPTVQQMQAGMLMPLSQGPPLQPGQQPQVAQQGQGQNQPILNDALSYLDQVKVQFSDSPDVYNRFLDIMKDFKSGAIDTPGVIGRVSSLFAGNPELIQGFNTFLPPGYRIECGPGNDPNAIRVTTPMGSSIHPMPQPPRSHADLDGANDSLRPPNGTSTPQPGQFMGRALSPSGRQLMAAQQPHLASIEAARQQEQQGLHHQDQRGVSSLQNALSAASGGAHLRGGASPRQTPLPGQHDPNADAPAGGPGMEKRGPVEFNHAISYVNKIKTRFSAHPDIYKQFLEILQTYQRESKPIQDVYSQVTRLFDGAPDLLEDFKQFLPESAAQAKAAENARRMAEESVITSNVRGEPLYASPIMSRETQIGTPHQHSRSNLPPVGNFAPTPVGKENRKRKERQGTIGSAVEGGAATNGAKAGGFSGGQPAKRVKQQHQPSARGPDIPPTSPTLIPPLPAPLPPTTTMAATHDELGFFERAKKHIGNKNTMNEFLKVCNLFSQDLIDRTALVHRARMYFGTNPDLMKWFTEFVAYDEKDIVVENKARVAVPTGRISLSNCRGLGPSYRLLPKRERVKTCSGRDELCNSVLNDEWASHPTWASEDSGFIAHRKNVHEEGLHRIEEERHDYDFNIEAAGRTVQLLEPIASQLRRMTEEEQRNYRLPPGLGGQSEAIYRRVIMKMYGRERGNELIDSMLEQPYVVVPVVLCRLKERLESWKLAQREWEKVWREQTQKLFWKSLDHQGNHTKNNDRRNYQTKPLQAEIQVKFEEMKAAEEKTRTGELRGKPQLELEMSDPDVVADVTWLLIVHIRVHLSSDAPGLEPFLREFVPMFTGIDLDVFEKKILERSGGTPINGEMALGDDNLSGAEELTGERRGRKPGKGNLLRQAVDKGAKGKYGRKDREDSNTSISRASTPDVASHAGDDNAADAMAVDGDDSSAAKIAAADAVPGRWFEHPVIEMASKSIDPNELHARHVYRLWANAPIFCFIRLFMHLYERLNRLKLAEADVHDIVKHAKAPKPANELGINDKQPDDFFNDTSAGANYYKQMLGKFVHVLEGEIELIPDGVEDCLRRFYLQTGYALYPFEKMVQALGKYGVAMVNQEGGNKERSWEILQLWKKDRIKSETSAVQSTDYRKAAEKLIGNGDTYRIEWDDATKTTKIFLVKRDDWFYRDDTPSDYDHETRWRYYVASYSSLDPTENVPKAHLSPMLLKRNVIDLGLDPTIDPLLATFPEAGNQDGSSAALTNEAGASASAAERLYRRFLSVKNDERLIFRIAVNNYHPVFQPGTAEGFYCQPEERIEGEAGVKNAEMAPEVRGVIIQEKFEGKGLREVVGEDQEGERVFEGVVQGMERSNEEGEWMDVDG